MTAWMVAHWVEVLLHLGIDATGAVSLRCVMGLCKHKHHQVMAWATFALIFSIATVALIG